MRRADRTTWTAVVPVLTLVPGWLLAMALFWIPFRLGLHTRFWLFCLVYLAIGCLLFLRPAQRILLVRLVGARKLTPQEHEIVDPVWTEVTQAMRSSPRSRSRARPCTASVTCARESAPWSGPRADARLAIRNAPAPPPPPRKAVAVCSL